MHRYGLVVRLAAALGIATLGCAPASGVLPSSTTTSTTTVAGPESDPGERQGSEAVVGLGAWGAPRTLNPLLDGPDAALLDVIAPAVFATGYTVDPDSRELLPNVLAEIPSTDNGGLVAAPGGMTQVMLEVAADAVWADGTPITAADLEFTYDLVVDETLPIRSDLRQRYDLIVPGTMVAAGRRLTFTMETDIRAELLFDLIVPRHAVEGSDFVADWNETMWVAGGPFSFSSYRPGGYLELVRNQRYWKADPSSGDRLPHLDRVVLRFFAGESDPRLFDTFSQRVLDAAVFAMPEGDGDPYRELGPGVDVQTVPGTAWDHINFQFGPGNRNTGSLNQHLEFRRAVAHAVDRATLASGRGTQPLESALRSYVPALNGDPWSAYPFDPERTERHLRELGDRLDTDLLADGGPRLVLTTASSSPGTVATAGEVAVMLEEAGIAAELQLEDSALFFGETLDGGTWDVGGWRYAGRGGRAGAVAFITMFDPEGLPPGGSNFPRWGTPDSSVREGSTDDYARIVDRLRTTVDHDEIDRLLAEAEGILADQVVLIPLMTGRMEAVAVWTDELEGVAANSAAGPLWNVETWRRVGDRVASGSR